MKKIILILLFLNYLNNLYSQITVDKLLFSTNGNSFKEEIKTEPIDGLKHFTKGEYYELEFKIEKFITNKFSIGLGLSYLKGDEDFAEMNYSTPYQINTSTIIKNINIVNIIPELNANHYLQLVENFYFTSIISFNYNFLKTDYSSVYLLKETINNNFTETKIPSDDKDFNNGFFSIDLYPQLTYFAFDKIGISLSLGGFEYTSNNRENYSSGFKNKFEPKYWRYGILYLIK